MLTDLFLEWFHEGHWREIGWRASTPDSQADLRKHGAALAAHGGRYRLVVPSIYRDFEPTVVREYPEVEPMRYARRYVETFRLREDAVLIVADEKTYAEAIEILARFGIHPREVPA